MNDETNVIVDIDDRNQIDSFRFIEYRALSPYSR